MFGYGESLVQRRYIMTRIGGTAICVVDDGGKTRHLPYLTSHGSTGFEWGHGGSGSGRQLSPGIQVEIPRRVASQRGDRAPVGDRGLFAGAGAGPASWGPASR